MGRSPSASSLGHKNINPESGIRFWGEGDVRNSIRVRRFPPYRETGDALGSEEKRRGAGEAAALTKRNAHVSSPWALPGGIREETPGFFLCLVCKRVEK